MIENANLEYTCIFGGGAIRGIAYIGALEAMEEFGVKIKTLAGSSVGAIFAGLLAVGYTSKEIKEIIFKVNYELFKDIQIGKSFGISKGEVFLEWIQELLEKKFYGENYQKGKNAPIRFSDLKRNLVIFGTNLAGFSCKEFSTFKTPDVEVAYAIRISAGMPGLMPPIKAGAAVLVDGDLQKSWPLWKLVPSLYKQKERILEFRLEGDFDIQKQGNIDFINSIYSCITSIATNYVVYNYAHKDKFDYIVLNTGTLVVIDFNISEEKRMELIEIGYNQTKKYFMQNLKYKKEKLLTYYIPLQNFLKNFTEMINRKKYLKAKELLGDFYLEYIQSLSEYIDSFYLEDLNHIKELFMEHYSVSGFFKSVSLKNAKAIQHRAEKLLLQINTHVQELKDYNPS